MSASVVLTIADMARSGKFPAAGWKTAKRFAHRSHAPAWERIPGRSCVRIIGRAQNIELQSRRAGATRKIVA
ncbi:hypothetical protein D3C76_715400 [compost metagenome]